MKKKKLLLVGGARPNFMKLGPLIQELKKHRKNFDVKLIHTEQHYDYLMSKVFFKELNIPKPDYFLGVKSASHAVQTARIMSGFEAVLLKEKPDLVIVVGDVNSTLACSITSAKLCIPVAHIESGLRSFDRKMPEEINRIVTDHLSDYLFTTCIDGNKNLKKEGISAKKIFFVGNIMIDSLKRSQVTSPHTTRVRGRRQSQVLKKFRLKEKEYAVLTLHRPSNVDNKMTLKKITSALGEVSRKIDVIFSAHPRTVKNIKKFNIKLPYKIKVIEPLGYLDFLKLWANSKFVLTDSGGIQEETTYLGVPCLTIRKNTERPITIKEGTNILVGTDKKKIIKESLKILNARTKNGKIPKYWDGETAKRIVVALKENL